VQGAIVEHIYCHAVGIVLSVEGTWARVRWRDGDTGDVPVRLLKQRRVRLIDAS
jgi:hypothetical protein